jgi:type VI secretion system protein
VARSRSLFGGKLPVVVSVAPGINQNSPVAVELVVVYKKPLLERLQSMPASEWFARRDQLLRDFPRDLEAWGGEWIPGQQVREVELDVRVGAKGGVVFADYFAPGDHRATFEPHEPIRLLLEADGFTVQPLG